MLQTGAACLLAAFTAGANPPVTSNESDLQADIARHERMIADAASRLGSSNDAAALAAAALFKLRADPGAALALMERASLLEPDCAQLTWLQAAICNEVNGCDPAPIEARFRMKDPANGLGWIAAIDRAYKSGEDAALASGLAQAARLPVVNVRYTTSTARLAEAAVRYGGMALSDAILAVAGELVGPGLPRLSGVSKACNTDRLGLAGRQEDCRAVARAMLAGDTVIVEMIGVAIAKRAWPANSPEWNAAARARTTYKYRSEMIYKHELEAVWNEESARRYLELLKSNAREQDVLVEQLIAAGIEPSPPDGWQEPVTPYRHEPVTP
jgi:hypothetical protein